MRSFLLIFMSLLTCCTQTSVQSEKEIVVGRHITRLRISEPSEYEVFRDGSDLSKLRHVEFLGEKIEDIPEEIGELPGLRSISFEEVDNIDWERALAILSRSESLESIDVEDVRRFHASEAIYQMWSLQELRVRKVDSVIMDVDLSQLRQLDLLSLVSVTYIRLPSESKSITDLKTLVLYDCHLDSIPEAFMGAYYITSMNLTDNRGIDIETVLKQIEKFPKLEGFGLAECDVLNISEGFRSLKRLKTLSLAANGLNSLPDFFSDFDSLTHLDLYDNKFSELPGAIVEMKSLRYLHLSNNPLGNGVCDGEGQSESAFRVYIGNCPMDAVGEACLQGLFPNAEVSRKM